MKHHAALALRFVLVLLAGCSSGSTPEPPHVQVAAPAAPEVGERRDEPARHPVAAPNPPRDPAPALDPAERRRRWVEARRAVAAGRRHAAAGRLSDALAAFDRAVALLPTPATRCELGWVAFRAGAVERAERELDAALRWFEAVRPTSQRMRRAYAACLYNRGQVAQAREDGQAARDAYRRSYVLRVNPTVAARLRELGEPLPEPDPSCAPDACSGPLASLDAVRERALSEARRLAWSESGGEGEAMGGGRTRTTHEPRATGGAGVLEIAGIAVDGLVSAYGNQAAYAYVAMRTERGWFACDVGGGTPTTWALDVSIDELVAEQLVPGGPIEVRAEVTAAETGPASVERFEGAEVSRSASSLSSHVAVCGLEGEAVVCWGRMPEREMWAEYEDDCVEGECDHGVDRVSSELSLRFARGSVIATFEGDDGPLERLAGTYPIARLGCEVEQRQRR